MKNTIKVLSVFNAGFAGLAPLIEGFFVPIQVLVVPIARFSFPMVILGPEFSFPLQFTFFLVIK